MSVLTQTQLKTARATLSASNRGLTYLCDLMMRFRVTSEPNPSWSAKPTLPDSSGSTGPGSLYNSAALGFRLIPRTTRSRRHCIIRGRREIQLGHTVLKHLRWQHNDPKNTRAAARNWVRCTFSY